MISRDEYFMREALKEAHKAFEYGEVPIGAIIVANNKIISKAHNEVERLKDPTAHAEMIAIATALEFFNNKYLDHCTLYVTIEPCPMCAGALSLTRISKIIYAASDIKYGYTLFHPSILHKKTEVKNGILKDDAIKLMKSFFENKR